MRLFCVITRGQGAEARTDYVLAADDSPRSDAEVAADAAVAANPDTAPIDLLFAQEASPEIDIDVRNSPISGTGPAKVFFDEGTDWFGRATQHTIAAKDQGADSAEDVATQAVTDVDATPPDWNASDLYAVAAKVHRAIGGGNWFATDENVGIPPPNFWIEQISWVGTPPDWDAITAYSAGDFVTTQPDGRVFFAANTNTNKDPRLFSVAVWSSDTIIVSVNLSRLGADVTIEV